MKKVSEKFNLQLLCFKIYHPLNTVLIIHRSIVCSPEHISKWHSHCSTYRKCAKESICLSTSIGMKRNMYIISLFDRKAHRCRSICAHEYMSTKDRKCYMHNKIFVFFTQWWHTFSGRNLTKTMNSSNKLPAKYRLVEFKSLLSII